MNHHSLALKVIYKNSSALLLGDIEASDEERLLKRYGDFLRSDIVKVAHHGSHTSSAQALIKTSKPKYAVISVGKHNTFGHPNPAVMKRWIRSGATVLRTDKEGALLFQSDGNVFRKVECSKAFAKSKVQSKKSKLGALSFDFSFYHPQFLPYLRKCRNRFIEMFAFMSSGDLHSDSRLPFCNNGIEEADNIDSFVQEALLQTFVQGAHHRA